MHTLRMLKELIKAGLAAALVLLVVVPRSAEAEGSLPPGWRVLAGGRSAAETGAPEDAQAALQEDRVANPVKSKKWMLTFFMGSTLTLTG